MSPGLSDPNWWPTPPQKPPQTVSTGAIAAGGIVLVALAVGIGYALLGPRSHHHSTASPPVRSTAAFQSCLKNQGALTPSAETNDALLRPAALACRSYVPLIEKSRDPVAAAQRALERCMQDAQSRLRNSAGSIGAIGGIAGNAGGGAASTRSAFEQANAVCRAESFDQPGAGGSSPTPAPSSIA